jgi:biopolymer transport protein ExbD
MAGKSNGEDGAFGFQIAPMVDVVFVLLLFFMACAGLSQRERFLKVPVPSGSGRGEIPIVIDIDADGAVFVNGSAMEDRSGNSDLAKLRQFLTKAIQAAPEDPVMIRPNMETRHERFVAVLDVCRSVHVKKLSFA